jgi:large subunit ribosomal protein L32
MGDGRWEMEDGRIVRSILDREESNSVILRRLCLYIYNLMAVPKKKTSKSKRDKRRATWVNKAAIQAKKALSLGKSVLTGRSTSFVYPQPEEEAGE